MKRSLRERFQSPEFEDVLTIAVGEAQHTSNEAKVKRLAAVLANDLTRISVDAI